MTMTTYPLIKVNGVDMDDAASRWGVRRDQPLRALPGLRTTSVVIPGRDGALWPVLDPYDMNAFNLKLIVFADGTTEDERSASLEQRLEALYFLMSQSPVELTYQIGPNAEDVRVAAGRLATSTTPDISEARDYAQIDFVFDLPDVFWRDATDGTYTSSNLTVGVPLKQFSAPFLAGSTAPVADLQFLVSGAWTQLTLVSNKMPGGVRDYNVNGQMRIDMNLTTDQSVYIDCGAQRAFLQASRSPAWADLTFDNEITSSVIVSGVDSAQTWLKTWPDASSGTFTEQLDRQMYFAIAAVGTAGPLALSIRGRRAFL